MLNTDSDEIDLIELKLKELYDERIQGIQKQVGNFFSELENDEIFKAIQENHHSREFMGQRALELLEVLMKSELEVSNLKMMRTLARTNARNKSLEDEVAGLKDLLRRGEEEKRKAQTQVEAVRQELDRNLKESDQKILFSRKELENSISNNRSSDLLTSEIEFLKQELKIRETNHQSETEDLKKLYDSRIHELESSYSTLLSQFQGYQRQSEDLSSEHQQVIKKLVDKNKILKSKVFSQKSRLGEMTSMHQSSQSNLSKAIEDYEDRIRLIQREANEKECEIISRHRTQLVQLQAHYQNMMNARLEEMQKEVDEQVRRSQEHDLEVKAVMDGRLREVERDFMLKAIHEKVLNDREKKLNSEWSQRVEEINEETDRLKLQMNEEIEKLRDQVSLITKDKSTIQSEISEKVQIISNLQESVKNLQNQVDKETKSRKNHEKNLKASISENDKYKQELSETNEIIEKLKSEFQATLLSKVNKEDYERLEEKVFYLSQELDNKAIFISNLENEIKLLGNNLSESGNLRAGELHLLETEREKLRDTKLNLQNIQEYSEHLLAELEYKDQQVLPMKATISSLQQEIVTCRDIIENKDKDLQAFKQLLVNKEAENRVRLRLKLESFKKQIKAFVLKTRTQLNDLAEMVTREMSYFKRVLNGFNQDFNGKCGILMTAVRRFYEGKVEVVENAFRKKVKDLEEAIKNEDLYWSDSETEGIRRVVKGLIESRQIAVIENRALKETVLKLQQDNNELYNQTKSLHNRFHQTMRVNDRPEPEILHSKFTSSLRGPFNPSRY